MKLIVLKFGGGVLKSKSDFNRSVSIIKDTITEGFFPIIVVSAMAFMTRQLRALVTDIVGINNYYDEIDVALTSSEQVSAAIMAMCLKKTGMKSRSFLSWQIPIITDNNFGNAKIYTIKKDKLYESITANIIPVICGYQGINSKNKISSLGSDGSDTTAVALASVFSCESVLYKNVQGVYCADPRIIPSAKKLSSITYDEMLEFTKSGSHILHYDSVSLAQKYSVPIKIASIEDRTNYTVVVKKIISLKTERFLLSYSANEHILSLQLPNKLVYINNISDIMDKLNIQFDMVSYIVTGDNLRQNVTFVLNENVLNRALDAIKANKRSWAYNSLYSSGNFCKISLIFSNSKNKIAIFDRLFAIFKYEKIDIIAISRYSKRIAILINEGDISKAVSSLGKEFIN